MSKILLVATLITLLNLAFYACQSPASTNTPKIITITTTPVVTTTQANPEMIQVVSVRGPLAPINPGGPNVEITIKNVSNLSVTALSATLYLEHTFNFTFAVSTTNPLLPGQTVSAKLTLIGAGFSDTVSYPMVLDVVLQDGEIFSLNKQVTITP